MGISRTYIAGGGIALPQSAPNQTYRPLVTIGVLPSRSSGLKSGYSDFFLFVVLK